MVTTDEWVDGAEPEEGDEPIEDESVDSTEEVDEAGEEEEEEGEYEDDDEEDDGDGDDDSDDEEEDDGEEEEADTEDEEPEEKTYTLKVNGREIQLTEEEALQYASKGMGAEEKFMEASKTRDQVIKLMSQIKEGDTKTKAALLKKIGVNLDEFAEDYLYEKIQRENMPEEQRKLLEAQDKIKLLQEEKTAAEKKAQEQVQQQQMEYYKEQYDMQISNALAKSSIPKTPGVISMVARYMEDGIVKGIDVSAEDAVALVREDLQNQVQSIIGESDEEALMKFIGEEKLRKISTDSVKKLKSPSKLNKVTGDEKQSKGKKKNKKRTWAEIQQDIYSSLES